MRDNNQEAAKAWNDRMQAVRHGCRTFINSIAKDGNLRKDLTEIAALDLFWALLSIKNWEPLLQECRWTQLEYERMLKRIAETVLVYE